MAGLALRHDETLGKGLMRVARKQLRAADEALAQTGDEAEGGIHQARVACKKLRALHRLAIGGTGKKAARRFNVLYRDVARSLSAARDAHVMLRTSERLGGSEQWADLHAELARRAGLAGRTDVGHLEAMAVARETLADHFDCAVDVFDLPDKFSVLESGLADVYTRGRKDLHLAIKSADEQRYHDWRKRVKDLGYAAKLLRPLWPAQLSALAKELKLLGDRLGEEHDATVLEAALRSGEFSTVASSAEIGAAAESLLAERQRLRELCFPVGQRLYAESTKQFMRRQRALWKVWKRER